MKTKRSKDYKKMMKGYKKLIIKDGKHAATDPFDWGPGLQVFVDHLYFMRDYYALGENVWAEEIPDVPSREQCLNMILAAYEAWMTCDEKYMVIVYKHEPDAEEKIQDLLRKGYFLQKREDKNCAIFHLYEDRKENSEKFVKEYEMHRKRFFELLSDYLEYLWD